MSHVVQTPAVVTDLDALKQAAESVGLEFMENQHTYKWYGTSVGDYPLPAGFTSKDLGKCEHALRVKGKAGAYEIGVCKRKGQDGYVLLFDFWNNGYGLMPVVGADAYKLTQAYGKIATMKNIPFGCATTETTLDNGDIVIEVDVPDEQVAVQY